jgi:glutamine synthetase
VTGADTSTAIDNMTGALTEQGVRTVHVVIPDLDGSLRERRLALPDLGAVFGPGGTFVNVLHKWDTADAVYGAGPFVGEAMTLDAASARTYPFEDDAALVFADYAGPSAAFSPREILKRQIARAETMGFTVKAALEFEFILIDETAESLRQKGWEGFDAYAVDNRCWSTQSAAIYADLVAELEGVLEEAGIGLFGLGLELGAGCFEGTLRACDALRAADDAVLFKTFTKAFARKHGLTASFMAQLSADFPGLSGHVHLSLGDAGNANLFHDPDAGDGMSDVMKQSIAGLVDLAPDALALAAHTVNAWRRLTPGNWAPRTASWAIQSYAAAVRAVPAPAKSARLEFRLPAADTNPYLALALTLGAALQGIETGARLPAPMTGGGPDETPEGQPGLPHDLLEAADRLDASATARAIFGDAFIDYFVASRRREEAVLRRHVSAFERARYIEAV